MSVLLVPKIYLDIASTDLGRPESGKTGPGTELPFLRVELRRWFPDVVLHAVEVKAVDVAFEVDVEKAYLWIVSYVSFPWCSKRGFDLHGTLRSCTLRRLAKDLST